MPNGDGTPLMSRNASEPRLCGHRRDFPDRDAPVVQTGRERPPSAAAVSVTTSLGASTSPMARRSPPTKLHRFLPLPPTTRSRPGTAQRHANARGSLPPNSIRARRGHERARRVGDERGDPARVPGEAALVLARGRIQPAHAAIRVAGHQRRVLGDECHARCRRVLAFDLDLRDLFACRAPMPQRAVLSHRNTRSNSSRRPAMRRIWSGSRVRHGKSP